MESYRSRLAFGLNLPILIIKEKGIEGGIFDQGSTGKFIHQVDFSNEKYLQSEEFIQPFNEWLEEKKREIQLM